MATKIRLQRFGRKNNAYYHIVIADSHSPRDGKFIERIGNYNPNTNPATINMDFERALYWLGTGAIPSDTANAILSYKGVLYKNHLLKGVKKNALTLEQAEEKFKAWVDAKESKVESKKTKIGESKVASRKASIEAETKVNLARTEKFAAKRKAELEALSAAAEAETTKEEEVVVTEETATAEDTAPAAE
ncbi:MAG: 30S ribosomal protein S16 [Bacteroidetes bacterium]|nr:30S ribosomal protein S16 [Bacteroidota bacterium]